MAHMIKIAEHDELPPGKGKTLTLEGREVTVFNQEGRIIATATHTTRMLTHPPVVDTSCEMPGHHFDVHLESSPARLRTDEMHFQVVIEEDGVYVLLDG